jgi:DNA-directed RNA polymerase subunit K/omega
MAIMKDDVTPKELKAFEIIESMVDSNQQKYLLINLLARRAREINEGARALVELPVPYTPIDLAIEEARQGKLQIVHLADLPTEEEGEGEEAEAATAEA